jgi:hypothetical protein
VWAVGDGAVPEQHDDLLAGRIAAEGLDRFLYLGDVYETGTAQEFATNYHSSFGRFKAISSPTPGNHEWANRAQGYDPYWGPSVRQADGGHYYSRDLGGWHLVSLNSEEDAGRGSAQLAWLRRDLARYGGTCTLAFIHRPRYSAGRYADAPELEALWAELAGKAVLLLSGHDHNYQRHRQDRGLVQFVVGTGGRSRYDVDERDPRLASADDTTFGALRLRLGSATASFEFIPTAGSALDSGTVRCRPHGLRARVRILRPRDGAIYPRLVTFRGRVRNARRAPRLTLVRRAGGLCRAFDGRRFRRARCSSRRSFAVGTRRGWRARPLGREGLPQGRYRLTARVRGVDGRIASHAVRFRVR